MRGNRSWGRDRARPPPTCFPDYGAHVIGLEKDAASLDRTAERIGFKQGLSLSDLHGRQFGNKRPKRLSKRLVLNTKVSTYW